MHRLCRSITCQVTSYSSISVRFQPVEEDELLEDVDEPEDDENLTLETLLESLNLSTFIEKFQEQHIDLETLTLCSEVDIRELGLPMGPRKKITGFLQEREEKKVLMNSVSLYSVICVDFTLDCFGCGIWEMAVEIFR